VGRSRELNRLTVDWKVAEGVIAVVTGIVATWRADALADTCCG
jgi:hypothetical protein